LIGTVCAKNGLARPIQPKALASITKVHTVIELDEQKRIIEFKRTRPAVPQKAARNRVPSAVRLTSQEVVIELVDEGPTQEMVSARERFWEKVFAELLPVEEDDSVKTKRRKR